jgi:hypothetical protein
VVIVPTKLLQLIFISTLLGSHWWSSEVGLVAGVHCTESLKSP